MSARLGKVAHCERVVEDSVPKVRVFVDEGDSENPELIEAELLSEPGVDALPLPGDEVSIIESEGSGNTISQAFADLMNPGKAEQGERRTYARADDGKIVAEVWLKKDGTVVTKNDKGKLTLHTDGTLEYGDGLFIVDLEGNVKFKGEVTAMAGTPDAPLPGVKLSTHLHPTGVGPTSAPTPGT